MTSRVVCLMGPTASGKTDLALALVKRFPLEIISVDSALVYRGMDVGTAKPAPQILERFPHHLINIVDPLTPYSAGNFYRDVQKLIQAISQRGRIPLLVGGTMLYFHSLQHGFSKLPPANQIVRKKITQMGVKKGWPEIHTRLKQIDPETAQRINPNDSQRIQRALEVYYLSGQTMSALKKNSPISNQPIDFINITLIPQNRAYLHQRITQRFDTMLSAGFIAEVKRLYDRSDLHADLPALRSVGYRQAWCFLNGEYDYATMRDRSITATRQLAKRQITWLRRWQYTEVFYCEDPNLYQKVMHYLVSIIGSNK